MRTVDAVLAASLSLSVAACAAEPEKKDLPSIAIGMTKESPDGFMATTLVAASPLPPLQGPNQWTVEIRTSSGDPVVDVGDDDAEVIANIYMAEHDHNIRKQATMTDPGVFEIPEFLITMNGRWEVTIVVHQDQDATGDADASVVFEFLIES
jgi:hypothetical protein